MEENQVWYTKRRLSEDVSVREPLCQCFLKLMQLGNGLGGLQSGLIGQEAQKESWIFTT